MNNSDYLLDLSSRASNFQAAAGVGEGWVPFTWETASRKGTGLACGAASGASELVIDLGLSGAHTLHFALGAHTALRVWLDGDAGFRELVTAHGGRRVQECRFHHADLTGKKLHIAPVNGPQPRPAMLAYIRATQDAPHRNARNLVATNDGWSWVALDGIEGERDVWKFFTPLRDSDFGLMLWGPGGADLSVCHQTKLGTTGELHPTHAFRNLERVHAEQLKAFFESGGDILRAAVAAARDVDIKIHFYIRVEAFGAPFPSAMRSQIQIDNPQWRCRDEFGDEILRLSYAHREVQDHMLAYFEEILEYAPDGLCFAFNRSLPMMICEAPVLEEFERQQGRAARLPEEADSPEMAAARGVLLSGFLGRVRDLLTKRGLEFSCMVPPDFESNRTFGLDLTALAAQNVFDSVMVHSGGFHAQAVEAWKDPQWLALKERMPVYLNGWGGSYQHVEAARFLQESVFDPGFAGGFFWDTENLNMNPHNWHVARQGGTTAFLDGVISGEIASPVFEEFTWLQGVKLGRYDPGKSY